MVRLMKITIHCMIEMFWGTAAFTQMVQKWISLMMMFVITRTRGLKRAMRKLKLKPKGKIKVKKKLQTMLYRRNQSSKGMIKFSLLLLIDNSNILVTDFECQIVILFSIFNYRIYYLVFQWRSYSLIIVFNNDINYLIYFWMKSFNFSYIFGFGNWSLDWSFDFKFNFLKIWILFE